MRRPEYDVETTVERNFPILKFLGLAIPAGFVFGFALQWGYACAARIITAIHLF